VGDSSVYDVIIGLFLNVLFCVFLPGRREWRNGRRAGLRIRWGNP
jgi:hypothetical protein